MQPRRRLNTTLIACRRCSAWLRPRRLVSAPCVGQPMTVRQIARNEQPATNGSRAVSTPDRHPCPLHTVQADVRRLPALRRDGRAADRRSRQPVLPDDRLAISGALTQLENLSRVADHGRRFGMGEVIHLQAIQHRSKQFRVIEFQAQLARAHESRVTQLAGRPDLIDESAAQRHLQQQLAPAGLSGVGQPVQQAETAAQMADHFREGTSRHRVFRCLEVIIDRTVCDTRFGEMVCQQLRLRRGQVAFVALESVAT